MIQHILFYCKLWRPHEREPDKVRPDTPNQMKETRRIGGSWDVVAT